MSGQVFSAKPGSIITHGGERWAIKEADGFSRVLAQRISDGRQEFLPVAELKPDEVACEPSSEGMKQTRQRRSLPAVDKLTRKDEAKLERAVEQFQLALAILAKPVSERAKLLTEYCKKYGCSQATAYRHLRIAKAGTAEDLLHAQRSDKGKPRLSPGTLEIIKAHLLKYRLVPTPRTVPDVLELINGALNDAGLPEVSRTTVYERLNLVTRRDQLLAQGRKGQARDEYTTKAGHLPDNDYPLGIIEIDHTPCQICFVDEKYRKPIGDAWLTLVIDCYSRMVLGFYLSFDAPSALNTGMALSRAFLTKEAYLAKVGVKGEWPCWGLPDVIVVDNAAELNGRMMHSAKRRYRFDIRDRPVGSPQFGGHVESGFKTFMFEIKSIPGTKFSNPRERAEYDSEGNAVMTLDAFEQYFTEYIVNDYNLSKHTGHGMNGRVPIQRWRAGIFEGDVFPPRGIPDIPVDPDELRISLMPYETRVVANGTVEIFNMTYYSNALRMLSEKVNVKGSLESRKFEVRYDPRDISVVWVYDPKSGTYITAPNSDTSMPPMSKWELDAIRRYESKQPDAYKQARYQSKVRREEMKQNAAAESKRARREVQKAARNAAESLVRPIVAAAPPPPPPASAAIDPAKIAALRSKVRTAATKPKGDAS